MSAKGSILVTGTNGGLGTAIVNHILKTPSLADNYTGIYTVRKASTATNLQAALEKSPEAHKYETIELDLSSIARTRAAAAEVNARVARGDLPPIRALILNAGYQDHTEITFTEDGFETSWQVNYLANLLLTLLLLQSMDKEQGRILLLGSWSHDIKDPRNESGGQRPFRDAKWQAFPGVEALAKGEWSTPQQDSTWLSGYRRYGASKLCAVMFIHELAMRLGQDPTYSNIAVLGLDPGAMATDLTRRGGWIMRNLNAKMILPVASAIAVKFSPNAPFRPMWKSAADVISACFDVEVPSKGKLLYFNGSEEFETAERVKDDDARRLVWEYGVKVGNIESADTVLVNWR